MADTLQTTSPPLERPDTTPIVPGQPAPGAWESLVRLWNMLKAVIGDVGKLQTDLDNTNDSLQDAVDHIRNQGGSLADLTSRVDDMVMPGTVWTVYCGLGGSDGKRPIPLGSTKANEKWALCDGTNGTPDLRGRVVIGAGGAFALGDKGGVASHTLNSPPSNTADATLTSSQVGFHEHFTVVPLEVGNGPLPAPNNSIAQKGEKNNYNQYRLRCSPNTPTTCRTSGNTGGGSTPHHHSIPAVSFGSISNMPPYLALYPIMRLPE